MKTNSAIITNAYKNAFFAFSILVSIPAVLFFVVGIKNLSFSHLIFWGSVLITVWGSFIALEKRKYISFWFTLVATSGIWLLLLIRTIQRINFVIENGGFEKADGSGSPLAFLIGLAGEQLFFLPASVVIIIGWHTVIKSLNSKHEENP